MTKIDFTIRFIKEAGELRRLSETLIALPRFALDIETADWWNRNQERVALIQFAYRSAGKIKVVILDALADLDIESLRSPLEHVSSVKIVHNAGFDAARLEKHYNFKTTNIFDTMLAARRSGERKYSLKAQAETHLGIRLDKSARAGDWSRRPLDVRQLNYAALDPYATLLLYEHQAARNLNGEYRPPPPRSPIDSTQNLLPLGESPLSFEAAPVVIPPPPTEESSPIELTENSAATTELSEAAIAVLGIIAELPGRYSPDALAASTGAERVGMAGWIIDNRLGRDAEPDEETVKLAIVDLCDRGLANTTETRRLSATEAGKRLWSKLK